MVVIIGNQMQVKKSARVYILLHDIITTTNIVYQIGDQFTDHCSDHKQ